MEKVEYIVGYTQITFCKCPRDLLNVSLLLGISYSKRLHVSHRHFT